MLFNGPEKISDKLTGDRLDYDPPAVEGGLVITTAMERMNVNIGDYIIRDVKGVFYPCAQRIFEETYEVFEKPEKAEEKVALIMDRLRGCINCVCLYGGIRYTKFPLIELPRELWQIIENKREEILK